MLSYRELQADNATCQFQSFESMPKEHRKIIDDLNSDISVCLGNRRSYKAAIENPEESGDAFDDKLSRDTAVANYLQSFMDEVELLNAVQQDLPAIVEAVYKTQQDVRIQTQDKFDELCEKVDKDFGFNWTNNTQRDAFIRHSRAYREHAAKLDLATEANKTVRDYQVRAKHRIDYLQMRIGKIKAKWYQSGQPV